LKDGFAGVDQHRGARHTRCSDRPGRTTTRGVAAGTQSAPAGTTTEVERTQNDAGSWPGGVAP